jgi:hypothetical protein
MPDQKAPQAQEKRETESTTYERPVPPLDNEANLQSSDTRIPEMLNPDAARAIVEAAIRADVPSLIGYRLTPPLPKQFPFQDAAVLLYFAYKARASRGGIIKYDLYGPMLQVNLDVSGDKQPKTSIVHLSDDFLGEHIVQPGEIGVEVLRDAAAILLASATSIPSEDDLLYLSTTYDTWRLQQPLIAEKITEFAPALYSWVDARLNYKNTHCKK